MSAFVKIMFINVIRVDSAMFGNERHFISFVAILSSRNGTEGTNFDIQKTVNASIKVFGYRLDRGGATGWGGGGWNTPTRQQIGKLLSQSATLDWVKITTEETKIDFLNN